MARIVKVPLPDGTFIDAIEQEFDIAKEEWNEYRLADGGRVRLMTTVQKVLRIVDSTGTPQYDANGDPKVIVRHNTQVVASE